MKGCLRRPAVRQERLVFIGEDEYEYEGNEREAHQKDAQACDADYVEDRPDPGSLGVNPGPLGP